MPHASWFDGSGVLLGPGCPLPLDAPFTPAQAEMWGVSRQTLRGLVAGGYVRRVLTGVYAAAQAPDNMTRRAQAVSLVVPPSAVVTDRTAAWLHGVDILPRTALSVPPPVTVFRAAGTRLRRAGVASGTRGLLPSDVMIVGGVRVTTPLRTACDLGRLLWRFDALAAIDGFLRLGVDPVLLALEVPRFRGFRGVRQLRVLVPLGSPKAESPGESALRLHWYDAGLPRPEVQFWVYDDGGRGLYRLDLALPELRYAAEYDGEEFHTADDDRAHDEQRRDWLDVHRHWTVDVFKRHDVYGPTAAAPARLTQGVAEARRVLAVWNARRTA
jgi:hypothetical protein